MIDTNVNEMGGYNCVKFLFKFVASIITLAFILFVVYVVRLGMFEDKMIFVNYMGKFGIWGPIMFVFLQLFQVVVPIIPGNLSCLVGVLVFGPVLGFVYNYIGLVVGAILVYWISKRYGINLIRKIFKDETINRYLKYVNNNKFIKFFFISIILPGFPDDLLCYIAGISSISFSKFLTIILVGKPIALLMYSLFIELL